MKDTNLVNISGQDKTIVAIVQRWNKSIFKQTLLWPKDKSIQYVLDEYQKILGDTSIYKIIDYK